MICFQGAVPGLGQQSRPRDNETSKAGEEQLRGKGAPHFSRLIAATTNDHKEVNMKKPSLLLILCMASMLAFAQTGSVLPPNGVNLTPDYWNFGSVPVGQANYETFFLTNGRSDAIWIFSISAQGDPPFSVASTTCSDPGWLYAHQFCTIKVKFDCQGPGLKNGTLKVYDTAGGSPQTSILTGYCFREDN
jgi:hypothetical protein